MPASWDECLRTAKGNIERTEEHTLEWQCRGAAKWVGHDEEDWRSLIGLVTEIEAGRIYAIDTRVWTDAERESWRNYMATR